MTPTFSVPRLRSNRRNKTAGLFHIQSDAGEIFGEFRSHQSAFSFLQRNGLEWDSFSIVSAESVRSLYKFWMPLPLPLSALQRTSMSIANH
jgi:hypothetical protein